MPIYKFSSKTCGPCMVATKKLNAANVQYTEIDAHENIDMCEQYNVKNIPTIIKTDDSGNEIMRLVGGECLNNDNISQL